VSTPFPASLLGKIRRSRLVLNENKASTESMFTRRRQVVSLGAGTSDRWEGLVETVPLDGTDLRTMWGFLLSVGLFGEITIPDPDYTGPQSGATTGLVQGAGQSGTSLIVDGVTASALILRTGEYFQVGTGFHAATTDCTANGSGVVTLNFKPALRVSPADDAVVTFNTPVLLARLTSMPDKDTDEDKAGAFTLSFEESL